MATRQNVKKKKSLVNSLFAKGSIDIPFFIILMSIVTIGLIMLFSASYTYSYYNRGSSTQIFSRQMIFAVLGFVAMMVISKIDCVNFRYVTLIVGGVSLLCLLLVLVLPEYKPGFKRWINLGFTTFQPSEIAKIALIMILALLMERYHNELKGKEPSEMGLCKKIDMMSDGRVIITKSTTTLFGLVGIIGVFAGLVYLEHHVSGTILMLALGVTMLWLGEVRKQWFVIGIIVVVVAAVVLIANPKILQEYAGERIVAWLDKDYSPMGARWQTNNSLYAIGSGGFLGTGLGQSKQKHLYVSEPQNDFIFSIVCEELGFVGAVAIIVLFALLIYRGIKIGMRAKDRFSALLVMGIVFQVGIQVALNIGVVSDLLPNTGISLPFFSAGGTSLVILLAEMGMVLSVSRSVNKRD